VIYVRGSGFKQIVVNIHCTFREADWLSERRGVTVLPACGCHCGKVVNERLAFYPVGLAHVPHVTRSDAILPGFYSAELRQRKPEVYRGFLLREASVKTELPKMTPQVFTRVRVTQFATFHFAIPRDDIAPGAPMNDKPTATLSPEAWRELAATAAEDGLIVQLADAVRQHGVMVSLTISPYESPVDEQ
jgi:hypothetical protein